MANDLNITQGAYGHLETGRRVITERTLLDICNKYKVNSKWLKTGEGYIFRKIEDNTLAKLSEEYNLDKLGQSILKISLQLTDEQKELIYELAKKLVDDYEK